jgi:hypothetical protein
LKIFSLLLISASHIARITGVNHRHPAFAIHLNTSFLNYHAVGYLLPSTKMSHWASQSKELCSLLYLLLPRL